MKAKDQIAKARAGLILDAPFFGSLVMRLTMIEEAVGTMMTDGESIKYDPTFVEKELSLTATKGVLAHEVMHCALAHHVRQGTRDPEKWNDACDHAINHILLDSGFTLTDGALHAPEYKGMSAEQIYSRLPSKKDDPNQRSKDGDGGGMGKVTPPTDGKGKQKSASEQAKSEADWKVATAQAAQQAKAMGELSKGLERIVTEIVNPKVDWLEVLRQFVNSHAKNDYAWFPPNRRYLAHGMYLPSTRSEELGDIVSIIDTSCSVDDDAVNQFAAELAEISEHYRVNNTVIHCDTKVQLVERFEVGDPIEIHPQGRGGTDFRPPFKEIEEFDEVPPCVVYLTDGECSRFPDDPGYPVLWAIYGRRSESFDPPFGDVVAV